MAYSPDGKVLASGSDDGTVRLWDAATRQPLSTPVGHTGAVSSVVFSPDSKMLASGSFDGEVSLWDAATGELLRTLFHASGVHSVAYSRDGKVLASGSDDGTVRLWDAATGAPLHTLDAHTGWVMSVAYSPDGKVLASRSGDGTTHLWDLRTVNLLLNPGIPSPRAALISGALQRLWGLSVDRLDIETGSWGWILSPDGYQVHRDITLGEEYGPEHAGRTFNIRPLLDPPPLGEDKLDQLLRWLKDQGM